MREHKYRAWDKKHKVMIYERTFGSAKDETEGFTKLVEDDGEVFLIMLSANGKCEYEPLYDAEMMQFTGRIDKNGKEIYEDTLLKDPQGNIGRVFYSEKDAGYLVNWHRKDGTWDTDSCIGYGEVIGDIHSNPELLEAENDKV